MVNGQCSSLYFKYTRQKLIMLRIRNYSVLLVIFLISNSEVVTGFVVGINSLLDALDLEFLQQIDFPGIQNRLRTLLTLWLPYTMGFVDLTSPLEVWNYLILCMPFVLFVLTCLFLGIPHILKFLAYAAKFWLTFEISQKIEEVFDAEERFGGIPLQQQLPQLV